MRLTDEWFTALSESDGGRIIFVSGRDDIEPFRTSGKFRERVEIYWKYDGDEKGMPRESDAVLMEQVRDTLKAAVEKNKLAILTGVYTGDNERTLVFYTRNIPAFGEMLNEALSPFELLPITIYTEKDPEWEEYIDMYEMKEIDE